MAALGEKIGTELIRKEVVDPAIKQIAARKYKFKQAVSVVSTSAWKGTFFRESTDILVGQTGNAVKGIPRGAPFPKASVTWQEVTAYIEKYGLSEYIFFEDIMTNDIDVKQRTIYKITEGVVKAVDDEIWSILTEGAAVAGGSVTNIQSVTMANNYAWNGNSASIIDNLMNGVQLIGEAYYETSNLMLFVNHKDYRSIMNYLYEKGSQARSVGEDVARNGRVPGVAGIKNIVVSSSVAASYSLLVVPKTVGTWKEALPLSSELDVEAFKGTKVTVCEMGKTELHDPLAAVLFIGTEGTGVDV